MTQTTQKTSLRETRDSWRLRCEDTLKARLRDAPPDLWYEIVRRADPERHADLIFWMINQKQCDFAVAAHVLLKSPIRFHIEAQTSLPSAPDEHSIWAAVVMNWHQGHYRNHELACDRADLDEYAIALQGTLRDQGQRQLSFPVPSALLDLSGGRPMALERGDDPEADYKLWRLCRQLELKVDPAPPGLPRLVAHMGRKASAGLTWTRDRVLSVRFQRQRHLFASQEAYLDWVSDYYVNRARHLENLRRHQATHDPYPALRFGKAAALSAMMGFMVFGGAAIGIVDMLRG